MHEYFLEAMDLPECTVVELSRNPHPTVVMEQNGVQLFRRANTYEDTGIAYDVYYEASRDGQPSMMMES